MSKRRPGPWVPLSVAYYDDEKLIEAGEFAEVMFIRMMAYAGRHPQWDGRLPRVVVLTRLGVVALESVPESVPEKRLEALLESGLVTAHGPHVQLEGWLNWNESGSKRDEGKVADRERKNATTRKDAHSMPEVAPENVPEVAPESGTDSGAQDKIREEEIREEKNTTSEADATDPARPEVETLCDLFADLIEGNGSKRPNVKTKAWRDPCRLMLDKDGRTVTEIAGAIRWVQADEFERVNVMSMSKLRERYDALRLKAQRATRPQTTIKQQATRDMMAASFERARLADQEQERLAL